MAHKRITWISPTGAGHTSALLSAVFTLIFMLAFMLFMLVSSTWGRPIAGIREVLTMVLLFPAVYYVVGWIMGYVAASAFNLISKLTGGLEVKFAGDRENPNNSFQADPDPRERGSGPLNSNR